MVHLKRRDNRNYGNDGIPVAPVAFLRVNEEALASAFYTTREQCKADMEPYAENMNDQELLAAIEQCVNSKTLENFNFIRTEEDVRVEDLNGGVSIAPTAFTSVSIVTVSEQEMRDNCKRSVEYKASNLNDAQVLKMIDLCVASQLLQTYHVGTTAIN